MLLTTLENTLAASLANPALSDGNRPMYIGLGTSAVAASLSDTALSADHIVTEIDSISVSGSKTTILWKLPYENGNAIPSPIREIGVYTKGGVLILRREFPLTEKRNLTQIYGKIVIDLPILRTQNGVDSIIDPCAILTGEVGTVVGETTLDPGESAYFAVSFPSANYAGLTYTGTLELVEASGNGAILRMPAGASGSYTVTWTASCGRSASASVLTWCIPSYLPPGAALVYPVNSGPIYAFAWGAAAVTIEDNIGLQEGDWYLGKIYLERDLVWLKSGGYLFGYYVYRGDCA